MKQNFEVFAHCLGEYSLQLCYGRISVEQYEVITENSTTEKNSEQSYYQSYKKVSQYLLRMKEQIPGNYQCLILNASNRQKVLFVCTLRSTCMLHFLFIFIIPILPQFLKLSQLLKTFHFLFFLIFYYIAFSNSLHFLRSDNLKVT